jgi:acetyltransferase-like isoleucine patch superfamily enzyme
MRFLALVFGWWVYHPYSWLITTILRVRGVRVGKNFYIQGSPYLKIRGRAQDIVIGNNVTINGDIDLRNRERGRIVIEDGVTFDTGCRLVAANNSELVFRQGCAIACYCIFNCGIGITVGEDSRLAGFCYLQDANYGLRRSLSLKEQPLTYGKIDLGREVWLGAHVVVLKGVLIGDGAVVGSNAVVTKNLDAYGIYGGVPAKRIGERPV